MTNSGFLFLGTCPAVKGTRRRHQQQIKNPPYNLTITLNQRKKAAHNLFENIFFYQRLLRTPCVKKYRRERSVFRRTAEKKATNFAIRYYFKSFCLPTFSLPQIPKIKKAATGSHH
jgi:hypothetical protein